MSCAGKKAVCSQTESPPQIHIRPLQLELHSNCHHEAKLKFGWKQPSSPETLSLKWRVGMRAQCEWSARIFFFFREEITLRRQQVVLHKGFLRKNNKACRCRRCVWLSGIKPFGNWICGDGFYNKKKRRRDRGIRVFCSLGGARGVSGGWLEWISREDEQKQNVGCDRGRFDFEWLEEIQQERGFQVCCMTRIKTFWQIVWDKKEIDGVLRCGIVWVSFFDNPIFSVKKSQMKWAKCLSRLRIKSHKCLLLGT